MRFATVRHDGGLTGAVVDGDRVTLVDAADAVQAYQRRDTLSERAESERATWSFDDVDLAPVSPNPAHILCVGLNYPAHNAELGRSDPTVPALFAKFTSTLTGSRDDIALPAVSRRIDGEVELAVVISRTVHREPVDTAASAIAGYTVANDLSMRDWQHRTSEALQGKVFDRSTPVGPVMVTPDEFDARDAHLEFVVDGQVWRTGSTADMIFTPAQLVSYCSMFMTLRPGDLILTGTPGRTTAAGDSLRPVLETRIDGLGAAINTTVADTLDVHQDN